MSFWHNPTEPAEDEGPVVIGVYDDPMEANLARAVLQQAGIECFLYDENASNLRGSGLAGMTLLGGARLVVSAAEAEQAKELLSQTGKGRGAPLR